jgi:uncharacterized membrane protein YagU involved in acid resistance
MERIMLSGAMRAIVFGTIAVGVFDALDAMVFFGLRGVKPIRVFQAIASGLLGKASFGGGMSSALLGVVLHFFIAFGIVLTYFLAAGKIEVLASHPVICGLVYGLTVYFFMNYVVIPLSAVNRSPFSLPMFLNGVFGHMLLVGLPCALIVRLGRGQ